MVLKRDAFQIAQETVDLLLPFLDDNELTIDRLVEQNDGKISRDQARRRLESLAKEGVLNKQYRRDKNNNNVRVAVYMEPK